MFSHKRVRGPGTVPLPQPDPGACPLGGQCHLPPPAPTPGGLVPVAPGQQRHHPPG